MQGYQHLLGSYLGGVDLSTLESADDAASASISALQAVTSGLNVSEIAANDAIHSSAIADLQGSTASNLSLIQTVQTLANEHEDELEAHHDRLANIELKNTQQDAAIAGKQDAFLSLVPPGHTSLLNIGENGTLIKTVTGGANITLTDHSSHVEIAADASSLGDVGCATLTCTGSAQIDGQLTVGYDLTCGELYALQIRGQALDQIITLRDAAIAEVTDPLANRVTSLESVVVPPTNGYSYLNVPSDTTTLSVRSSSDQSPVCAWLDDRMLVYKDIEVSVPISGAGAPYTKAETYSKSETDALLEDKEATLLLMPGELQRVLDGSGGQLAFKLGLHSDFLDRIAALEASSGGGDVATQIATEDTITVNGVFQVKHGSIERNGTQPEGGIYMGEGGTGDFAIEMVGMHNNAACYIDMCRLGNDFRMRFIYYLGADYLKIFTQAARSMELRVSGLSANGYSSFSDARLKDEVQPLPQSHCVDLVKSVEPKSYVRNDIEGSGRRIGFIAQEIQAAATGDLSAIIGEADGDHAADHYLTVDYPKLTTVLWSVCQNLLKRVEELENRL